ncbi:hypothetical protein J6590_042134 [Homalodisca vitripennis]|nr:hypothetical protein J6590_042134 [Homalodisca vitripennis]
MCQVTAGNLDIVGRPVTLWLCQRGQCVSIKASDVMAVSERAVCIDISNCSTQASDVMTVSERAVCIDKSNCSTQCCEVSTVYPGLGALNNSLFPVSQACIGMSCAVPPPTDVASFPSRTFAEHELAVGRDNLPEPPTRDEGLTYSPARHGAAAVVYVYSALPYNV